MRDSRTQILRRVGVSLLLAIIAVRPVLAGSEYWKPTSGSNAWNSGAANWSGTNPEPYGGDTGYSTNTIAANTTNTIYYNSGMSGTAWNYGGMVLSNSGAGINQLLINSGGQTLSSGTGLLVGNNGILSIQNGATFQVGGGNLSLTTGGTIILNGSAQFLNTTQNWLINGGNLVGNAGVGNTATYTSQNTSKGVSLQSGYIIANSGTFWFQTDDAWDYGGLSIQSGGTVQVNSGATFILDRYVNTAWNSGPNPTNSGVILLNGGTFTFNDDGSGQNASRKMINNGTIIGSGTLAASIGQNGSGIVIASNGVLNILGTDTRGNQAQIYDNGGQFGTYQAVSGGDLKVLNAPSEKSGANWKISSGGTLEIANNVSLDLGFAFMPPNNLAGAVQVDSGANLTLSSAASGAAYSNSTGSSFLLLGGQINTGYASNQPPIGFFNYGTMVGVTGNGTFATGNSSGGNGLENLGTILATNSGATLYIEPGNAYYNAFSNAVGGSIIVSNGATLAIQRTDSAWNLTGAQNTPGDTNVVNLGNVLLNNGTITLWGSGGVTLTNYFRNAGTISVAGGQTGYVAAAMNQLGTLALTNNLSVLSYGGTNALTNSGTILLGGNGAVATMIASNIGAHGYSLFNAGTIQGQGTLTLGLTNATGGANAHFVNTGLLVATNWGGAAGGTLFISVGNAFSDGGFSNTASGTILITSNMTLTVNRSETAWAGSGNSVANAGTILVQGGSLNLAADGVVSNSASFINTGLISGYGTINSVVITTNGGKMLAVATNLTGVGTLTASIASTTNNSTATLGVVGTNSVLNILTPGGQNVLLNFGTISLSGGSINLNGGSGTITNYNIIAGVGNASSFPIVNAGTLASFVAQGPIAGLSNLIATVNATNTAFLSANNLVGGAATLTLGATAGVGLVNNGTIALQGGFITVTNATGADAGITNLTGLIYGRGTQSVAVANLSGGTILASNGILRVGMIGPNAGVLSNFNSASTIVLTNTVLVNSNNIALNGGGLIMGGSTITNEGTISGPGNYSSGLYNDTTGTVVATGGTLAIATNGAPESVNNLGTFSIASASTLNVVPDWNNTNGLVSLSGGTLTGGAVTNKGTVAGSGTITSSAFVNTASGTVTPSSGGTLNILSPTAALNGTMIAGTSQSIVMTNLTSMVNGGTMILNGAASDANASFLIMRNGGSGDFTNAAGGVIRGAGYFATGISGGTSFTEYNLGAILATNGSLILQPFHAFGNGGFVNLGGGTVTVAAASTFGIQRNNDAWSSSGTVPINAGLIQINGGSVTFYGDSLSIANDRAWSNAPTGVISGFGTLMSSVNNLGTVVATNGNLNINNAAAVTQSGTINIANNATLTVIGGAGSFQNNAGAQMLLSGGTFVGTNFTQFGNQGTISGSGTIQTGRLSGGGGASQPIINLAGGIIDATNGTLFLNPGDTFDRGGLSNGVGATLRVENNATLTLNRTANAWNNIGVLGNTNPRNSGVIDLEGGSFLLFSDGAADPSRFVENIAGGLISGSGTFSGSISNFSGATIRATGGTLALQGTGKFLQAGTLEVDGGATMLVSNSSGLASVSNAGTILMNGGTLLAGAITNASWIFGNGSITGNVSSGVINLSASFLFASNGVLSASLGSFTNGTGVTMGTLSTNSTLDVQMPGGAGQPLINLGTLSFAGGTLLANGTGSGIITNVSGGVIVGVGNVTQTVANNGTILAANPVSGLNIFSVGLSDLNTATIGASNGAILNVVLSGGAGSSFDNNGSVSMLGGTLIISNGTPGVISNMAAAFVTGVGTVMPNIVNLGTVQSTVVGGILDVSLSATNAGFLRAGTGATLTIENGSFVNAGTIGAVGSSGGTIQMAASSGIITNSGLITGFGGLAVNGFVQNGSAGRITATNGVLAFNAINGLANAGTIDVQNGGTFQSNSSNSWNNAGSIDLRGGTLRTGGFTNASMVASFTNTASGVIDGYGTLIGGGAYGQTGAGFDKSIINFGTIIATNPISGTAQTLYVSTGGATTGGGIENLGTMIVSSNNTLALDRGGLPVLNTGTITINNGTLASTSTITNTLNGIIQGYGTLTASIVNQSGGTIRATNGLLTMTSAIFPINQGTFEIDGGATMTWDTTNSWQNNGTVSMLGGTLRTGGPTNVNAGGEPFTNVNYIVGFGTIIGGGAFNTNGPGIDKAILNLGTIVANGGTLIVDTGVSTLSNGIANFGTMIVSNATDTLDLRREAEVGVVTNNNFIVNTGTILINGGTLTANTAITNQFVRTANPGLIQGFGTIALTNQLVNLGTVRSTNTVLAGNGVLRFVNPVGSALQINQSGTLVVEGGSQMIFGSDTNAPLLNGGTIVMNGGILRSGVLTNSLGATFGGFGTMTSSIINSGTGLATSLLSPLHLTGSTVFNQTTGVLGANHGKLIVDTVFTNAGTVSFLNSVGTFASAVVNQGAWVMDPSTNVFLDNYTVATNGYLTMAAGDVNIFKSNFVNVSSLSNQYNTLNGKFVMDGQGTQQFFVAGINLGGFASSIQPSNEIFFSTGSGTFSTNGFSFAKDDSAFGYSNNFALGTLELSDVSTTVLMDSFGTVGSNDNNVAGLYLDSLTLDPGSLLIISNNVELYFHSTNGVTGVGLGTLGAGDNVLILDGGSLHQLTVVPEPSVLMLLSIGAFAIVGYRRRKARLGRS